MNKKWNYLIESDLERRKKERLRLSGAEAPLTQAEQDREQLRYQIPKWEKNTNIRILTNSGAIFVKGEILNPLGVFAVIREIRGKTKYNVTHLPTGLRTCSPLGGKGAKAKAKKFAEALQRISVNEGVSWLTFRTFRTFGPHAISEADLNSLAKIIVKAARLVNLAPELTLDAAARCNRNKIKIDED